MASLDRARSIGKQKHRYRMDENDDKVRVVNYLREYQKVLREFRALIPFGLSEPSSISASIGRIRIHPCKDGAVVLTYHDESDEITIESEEEIDRSVTAFTKESEIFRYYDRFGDPSSVRLSFNADVPDASAVTSGFSISKYDNTDVIAWAKDLSNGSKKYGTDEFFRPLYKRMSV